MTARGVEVWAPHADAVRIDLPGVNGTPEFPDDLDLVFVLGGDGTLLRAADAVGRSGVPLLGVNFGHLGFLSELERSELDAGLKRLLADGFTIEERMMLEAEIVDSTGTTVVRALNDIMVAKVEIGRAIRLAVVLDDEPFVSWAADGLIVATSTGSTAYSFSAGGPVVSPRVDCFVVTPVSPHGLFDRSLVIPQDEVVTLKLIAEPDAAALSADGGPAIPLSPEATISVRAAEERIKLAKLEPAPFWRLVREKFRLPSQE